MEVGEATCKEAASSLLIAWLIAIYPCKWSRETLTISSFLDYMFVQLVSTLSWNTFDCLWTLELDFSLWDLCFGPWICLCWTCCVFSLIWESGLIGSSSNSCVGNPKESYAGLVKSQEQLKPLECVWV